MFENITSLQNVKIRHVVLLRKASERKSSREIIIEGQAEISMAISAGIKINSVFYCPKYTGGKIAIRANQAAIYETTPEVFKKISYREHPDGYLATAKRPVLNLDNVRLGKKPLVIVLEAVEKPGNLGAILRTADAAGADAVVVCDPQTDIFNPNVIRTSLGTVFTSQLATSKSDETIQWLTINGISIYATAPAADKFYFNLNFMKPAAIIIGAEHEGLSRKWLDAAEEKIKIPMLGKINSLNASSAAAVVACEAVRQRMAKK